jgi:hypothetical protein
MREPVELEARRGRVGPAGTGWTPHSERSPAPPGNGRPCVLPFHVHLHFRSHQLGTASMSLRPGNFPVAFVFTGLDAYDIAWDCVVNGVA